MRFLLCVFVFISSFNYGFGSNTNTSNEPFYLQVAVQEGDGIYGLLRRYALDFGSCNFNKFLALNKITKETGLDVGKRYQLPVLIYRYDGKSIRTTIDDTDYEKAVRIQKYNVTIKSKGLRQKDYVTSKVLWVPFNEIGCDDGNQVTEKKKVSDTSNKVEALFGGKYQNININDHSLEDHVFYVVSGHGGPDPGAVCKDCPTMCEDEYAYDVSLRLARLLLEHGATVHIVIQDKNDGIRDGKYLKCDNDEVSYHGKKIPINQVRRLNQRINDINKLYKKHKRKNAKSQTVISIHVDSQNQSMRQDVFFYHLQQSKSGKKVAKNLHETFQMKYDKYQKGRGYKGTIESRGLYILRKTHPTAVFVELANIRNKSDHKRITLHSNRQALAKWLYEGLRKSVL